MNEGDYVMLKGDYFNVWVFDRHHKMKRGVMKISKVDDNYIWYHQKNKEEKILKGFVRKISSKEKFFLKDLKFLYLYKWFRSHIA